MAIVDWPAAERPREKLLAQGASSLSDAELLAIFLRVGTPGISAVDLARHLLNHYGSLNQLFSASRRDIGQHHGLGDAKYAQLQAVLEMARRALGETLRETPSFSNPQAVRDYLQLTLAGREREVFLVLLLDTRHRLLVCRELFNGTINEARVYPREVVREALLASAAAVIVAHNHPSGETRPSSADIALTQTLKSALAVVDIPLLDHFIVGQGQHAHSMAESCQL